MRLHFTRLFFGFAMIGALSACGGGGGGGTSDTTTTTGSTAPDFSNPITISPGDPLPTDTSMPVQISGTAVESQFGSSGFGAFGAPVPATLVTSTGANGVPDALRITANGETVEIDLRQQASSDDVTFDGTAFNINTASGSFIIQPFAFADNPLSYATYGGWAQTADADPSATVSDKIRFGAFGVETLSGSRPSADATYSGNTIGIASLSSGSNNLIGFTTSDLTVTTSGGFSSVNVNSTNTEFSTLTPGGVLANPSVLDFTGSGAITSEGFVSTDATTAAGDSGRIDGKFYGPNAEEVGGTFGFSGPSQIYGGAFGAKR